MLKIRNKASQQAQGVAAVGKAGPVVKKQDLKSDRLGYHLGQ